MVNYELFHKRFVSFRTAAYAHLWLSLERLKEATMAKQPTPVTVHRSASRTRQMAKKVGLKIPEPSPPNTEDTELEQTDTM
jgi:hypothetical protein